VFPAASWVLSGKNMPVCNFQAQVITDMMRKDPPFAMPALPDDQLATNGVKRAPAAKRLPATLMAASIFFMGRDLP